MKGLQCQKQPSFLFLAVKTKTSLNKAEPIKPRSVCSSVFLFFFSLRGWSEGRLNKVVFIFLPVCFSPPFTSLLAFYFLHSDDGCSWRVPGERRLKLMTSHDYKHHGATKAWRNDRSSFQYILTNKLVPRCFALHNRCGGSCGTEQETRGEKTRKKKNVPHLGWSQRADNSTSY